MSASAPRIALIHALRHSPAPQAGFGCADPNAPDMRRRSDNEISFLGCADFPNPLVRCPSR